MKLKFTLMYALGILALSGGLKAQNFTIGTGTSSGGILPINSCYNFSYSQQIYTASDITTSGASAGNIYAIRFFYNSGGTTVGNWNNDWVVYLANTTQNSFTSLTNWIPLGSLTEVYSGAVTTVSGNWVEITLATPFYWNGTDNLVVAIDENTPGFSCTANWNYTSTTNTQSIMYRSDPTNPDPASPPTAYGTYNYTANLQLFMPPLTAVAPDTLSVPCYGDPTDIPMQVLAGSAPYTITWSTTQVGSGTSDTLFNASPGSYSVTVVDNNGDADTAYIEIVEPDSITSSAMVSQQLTCDYDISQVVAMASGGSQSTGSYFWDTASINYHPDSSQVGTLVSLGDDDVSAALPIGFDFSYFGDTFSDFYIGSNGYITFDAGTGSSYEQTLPNGTSPNNVIAMVWEDVDPNGGLDGTVSYYTTGSMPNRVLHVNFIDVPYWNGAIGDVTVQLKLYEISGCIEIHTTYAGFSGSAAEQTQGIENGDGTEAYTYPGRNGQVWSANGSFISFCPTDTSGLYYNWSTGHVSAEVNGLTAGTYTVTVSDVNGCSKTHEVTVNSPVSSLTSNASWSDVTCFGVNDGSINSGITGGSGNVTYAWSDGQTTAIASDLGPGTYSVSAEDVEGCTIEVHDVTIWEPSILLASVTSVQGVVCPGDTTGSAMGVASGGVQPYTYVWAPIGATGQSISGISNGNYNLVATDANGCESYTSVAVLASSSTPIVDLGDDIYDTGGGTHILNAGSHAGYSWTGGSAGSTLEVTATGTYKVTVTNAEGCEGYDEVYVEIWPTGINSLSEGNLKVYPNPATSVINLEFSNDLVNATLNIVDAKGATISSSTLGNSGLATVNVESIPSGVYTLSVVSGSTVSTHKLVISK